MAILEYLQWVIEACLWGYFGFASAYILLFAIAGRFPLAKKGPVRTGKRKMAVLIPGYKEDKVIVQVAQAALEQTYGRGHYEVIVIADSFQAETLDALRALPITLVEVVFDTSTKSKALNRAMEVLQNDYEIAVVLDADNIMDYDFLERINAAFDHGYKVVQGHRVAKNTNTPFAILDAISEEVNNHIFRKGHRVLGLSSALIGSGMAFEYPFFKKTMAQVKAVGGFDKELELKLLRAGETIAYLPDAYVADEKVQKDTVFSNQRKRWLSAQFVYFQRYALDGVKELFLRGNLDFADKVYQMIAPPRILLLGLAVVFASIYSLDAFSGETTLLKLSAIHWYWVLAMTVLAFALAIPKRFYRRTTLKALLTLPKAFGLMFLSLFKLKGANKKFIHTEHGTP